VALTQLDRADLLVLDLALSYLVDAVREDSDVLPDLTERVALRQLHRYVLDLKRSTCETGEEPGVRLPGREEVRRAVVVADARHPRDVEKLTDALVGLLNGRGPTCVSGDGHAGPCTEPATGLWRGAEDPLVLLCDRHSRRWAECGWTRVRRL
jgi:hypothetical protein